MALQNTFIPPGLKILFKIPDPGGQNSVNFVAGTIIRLPEQAPRTLTADFTSPSTHFPSTKQRSQAYM